MIGRATGGLGHHDPEGMRHMLLHLFPRLEPHQQQVYEFVESIPIGTPMQTVAFELVPQFVVRIHKELGIEIEPSECGKCTWLREMMERAECRRRER